jgi:hypothetical protein
LAAPPIFRVEALAASRAAADIYRDELFHRVRRGDALCKGPLTDPSVALIVKRLRAPVCLDPAVYAGHSLGSGLRDDVQDAQRFQDHAAARLLKGMGVSSTDRQYDLADVAA